MCCNDNIYRPIFYIVNIGLFNIIHLKCILFATMILYISNTIIIYIVVTMIHLLYGFFMLVIRSVIGVIKSHLIKSHIS